MERAFDIANDDGGEVSPIDGQRVPHKIGTGHLLLAMLDDTDTRASQLLHKILIDASRVRTFLATLPSEV